MRLDGPPVPAGAGEIRACLVVRDEAVRIASCLEHHRGLGVDRFLVVDNGSTDGTLEHLLAQPDVHVFRTEESFARSHAGYDWRHTLLDEYCEGAWALVLDADEAFVFPACEQIPIRTMCAYLESVGAQAVLALMIDMYGAGDVSEAVHTPGALLVETCRFFDAGPYDAFEGTVFPGVQFAGGPRARAFDFSPYQPRPPLLGKIPLVRWSPSMRFTLSNHAMTPVTLAPIRGALLHFKFLADFESRVRLALSHGQHHDGSREYRAYLDRLADGKGLTLRTPQSARLSNSGQLCDLGIMLSHESYEAFVSGRAQTE